MKNLPLYLMAFLCFFCRPLLSQVAVNTNGNPPDASAMLDVNSPDKGLLIPRVTLISLEDNASPVSNPAAGLLVYNAGGSINSGFYYWNGLKWSNLPNLETISNMFNAIPNSVVYGEMYEFHSSGSFSSINITSPGSWTQWNTATQGEVFGISYASSSFSIMSPGTYSIDFNATIKTSTGGKTVEVCVAVNNVPQNDLTSRTWFIGAGNVQNISVTGFTSLNTDNVVTIKFTQDGNGEIRLENANLSLKKVN